MCIGAAGGCAASIAASVCTACTCKICGSLGKTVSMATRLTYGLMLLLGSVVAIILNMQLPSKWLSEGLSSLWFSSWVVGTPKIPAEAFGKFAVYRVMGGMAMFHLIMAVIMIKVVSSTDPRAKLNNGWWCVKIVLWVGSILLNFFIVPGSFFAGSAGTIFKIGACAFLVLQCGHLVSFTYFVWDKLSEGAERDNDEQVSCGPFFCNCYGFLMVFGTLFMYSFHVFVLVYAIVVHTNSSGGCPAALWGSCIGFLLMIGTGALSISNVVREAPNGEGQSNGVGQSSVVAAYASYLVLSAMVNNPEAECRAFHVGNRGSTTIQIVGLFIVFLSVLWSAIRMGSSASVGDGSYVAASIVEEGLIGGDDEDTTVGVGKTVKDDESEEVQYSYSLFHFTFGVAAMYLCMILTEWGSIDENPASDSYLSIHESAESVWIKVVFSWVCYLLYSFVMMAPPMFPDREFSATSGGDIA